MVDHDIRRVICLANSRRPGGRCIAGREILEDGLPGAWIRPISDREEGGVSEYERQYEDGSEPQILDVIDIPLREPRPETYQQENWLLDPDYYWTRVGRWAPKDLAPTVYTGASLWEKWFE